MRCLAVITLTLLVLTGCQTIDYIRPLAEQSDAEAQYELGSMFHTGQGVMCHR